MRVVRRICQGLNIDTGKRRGARHPLCGERTMNLKALEGKVNEAVAVGKRKTWISSRSRNISILKID